MRSLVNRFGGKDFVNSKVSVNTLDKVCDFIEEEFTWDPNETQAEKKINDYELNRIEQSYETMFGKNCGKQRKQANDNLRTLFLIDNDKDSTAWSESGDFTDMRLTPVNIIRIRVRIQF